jgi:hypothetical protein
MDGENVHVLCVWARLEIQMLMRREW